MRRRRGGGTGGEGGGLPSAPSPLTQIVPNSASIYSVFPSVNYNSVAKGHSSVLYGHVAVRHVGGHGVLFQFADQIYYSFTI